MSTTFLHFMLIFSLCHVSGLNGSTSLSGPDSYILTLANAKLGDTINGGWTANYAEIREHHDFFLRGAAQKWASIVDKNGRRAKFLASR